MWIVVYYFYKQFGYKDSGFPQNKQFYHAFLRPFALNILWFLKTTLQKSNNKSIISYCLSGSYVRII